MSNDVSSIEFSRSSFVRNCDLVRLPGSTVWMDYTPPRIGASVEDREVVLEFKEWPDEIARHYLGDAKLWWIIAAANQILDPMVELYPGRRLIIPSATKVREQIQGQGKIGVEGGLR